MGKHEGKRPLGRPRRRWEDNIMMKLDVGVWNGSRWLGIGTGGRALVNAVMNLHKSCNLHEVYIVIRTCC